MSMEQILQAEKDYNEVISIAKVWQPDMPIKDLDGNGIDLSVYSDGLICLDIQGDNVAYMDYNTLLRLKGLIDKAFEALHSGKVTG